MNKLEANRAQTEPSTDLLLHAVKAFTGTITAGARFQQGLILWWADLMAQTHPAQRPSPFPDPVSVPTPARLLRLGLRIEAPLVTSPVSSRGSDSDVRRGKRSRPSGAASPKRGR